jgi:hypothetical protein
MRNLQRAMLVRLSGSRKGNNVYFLHSIILDMIVSVTLKIMGRERIPKFSQLTGENVEQYLIFFYIIKSRVS